MGNILYDLRWLLSRISKTESTYYKKGKEVSLVSFTWYIAAFKNSVVELTKELSIRLHKVPYKGDDWFFHDKQNFTLFILCQVFFYCLTTWFSLLLHLLLLLFLSLSLTHSLFFTFD